MKKYYLYALASVFIIIIILFASSQFYLSIAGSKAEDKYCNNDSDCTIVCKKCCCYCDSYDDVVNNETANNIEFVKNIECILGRACATFGCPIPGGVNIPVCKNNQCAVDIVSLTININPEPAHIGSNSTISVKLTKNNLPYPNQQILFKYENHGDNRYTPTLFENVSYTDSNGEATANLYASVAGEYSISATWGNRSEGYGRGTSVTFKR